MNLLFKYPSRSRPRLFMQNLSRYRQLLSGKHNVQLVVSADVDDNEMNTPEIRAWLDAQPNLVYRFGSSKTKIEAINADMDISAAIMPDWSVLLLISDDMIPMLKGYDDRIATDMQENFPDFDGCLWYPDGRREDLNTLSILGRKYYDRLGFIYFPGYESYFCDDEHQAVATAMGKLKKMDEVIIGHAWTSVTGRDALYEKNSRPDIYARDKSTFAARSAAGFPDPSGLPISV
jgi:hypothetical protein